MKTTEVTVENGVLKLAPDATLPRHAKLALLVIEADDLSSLDLMALSEASGALDFLNDEPDLYSDADIKPENRNPKFRPRNK